MVQYEIGRNVHVDSEIDSTGDEELQERVLPQELQVIRIVKPKELGVHRQEGTDR